MLFFVCLERTFLKKYKRYINLWKVGLLIRIRIGDVPLGVFYGPSSLFYYFKTRLASSLLDTSWLSKRCLKFSMTRRTCLLLVDEATCLSSLENWFHLLQLVCNFAINKINRIQIVAFFKPKKCATKFIELKYFRYWSITSTKSKVLHIRINMKNRRTREKLGVW